MAEYHDLVKALTWLVVQKLQHQGRYVRGLLGDGQGHVQVPERPDYSYVRPDRYTTRKFEVFNKLVDGYDGMPVVLGELPWQPGLTQVLAVDWDTYEGVGWGDQWSGVKKHGRSHESRDGAPGYDTFNVYRRQFGDLKTYPLGSGSLSVYVSAYNFTHLESLKTWPGYPGLSLGGAVPSATGTARMVLVYWDPASGTAGALGVASGTVGADAGPEIMDWPYAPPGTIPSAWVKLRGGQGFVSEFDIWDARQPWTPTLEFSTGSAGIWAGLIPIADGGGFFTGSTVEQALQELGAGGSGAPSGPAGGDLTGSYPNPNLGAVWGYPIQSGAPAQGDIWMFSGTAWRHIPSNFPTTLAALDDVFLAHPPVDGEMLVYRTADVAWTNEDGKDTHDHSKLAASDGVPNPAWSVDAAGNLAAAGAYSLDVNAGEIILDADADTSLTADTDDQIDVKIGNADEGHWTVSGLSAQSFAFRVKNTSGGAATANNVGYINDDGEYKTTTTAYLQAAWCVVVKGGADNADIYVAMRGRVTVALNGNCSAGDFLYTSTTAGQAQPQTYVRPEIFAVALTANAGGAGGTCSALLLCNRKAYSRTSSVGNIIRVVSSSDSDWRATINGAPVGAVVTYNVPLVSGTEDAIVPYNAPATSYIGNFVLHNTTRGDYALIASVSTAANTITLTANAPGAWANGDSIQVRSDVITTGGALNYLDVEIPTTSTEIPILTVGIFAQIYINDAGAAIVYIHPYDTYNQGQAQHNTGATQNYRLAFVPMFKRRLGFMLDASGSATAQGLFSLGGIVEAVP